MKALNLIFKLGVIAALAFAVTACNTDPCKDTVCNNGGTCLEGNCTCPSGYEGDSCQTKWSTKFVAANRNAVDVVTGPGAGTYNYAVDITSSSATAVSIGNFGGFGTTVIVPFTVTATKAISVSNYVDATGRKFTGTGAIGADGNLVANYTVTYTDNTVDTGVATVDLP